MGKKIKNKDIAARLGVSSTLVSLVLNNRADEYGIKKETQEKVFNMAKEMSLSNDTYDEKLVSSYPIEEKPGIIGMIVPSLNDPFVIQITPFLQTVFLSMGVGFSIIMKDPDDQRYDRLIGSVRRFYSGLILLGDSADENTVRTLRANNYPFVVLEKDINTLRLNAISTDTEVGASLVINHIKKLGYSNIIIVADQKSYFSPDSGTKQLLDVIEKTPEINSPAIIEISKTFSGDDSDFFKFENLLRPPFRAEVIIVVNANFVYPIMHMLKRKGLRIPQDIALISMEEGIGFDLMFSPVTTLRKKLPVMSVKVANMLWSEVKNSGKGKFKRQVSIPPEFVVRNSSGA